MNHASSIAAASIAVRPSACPGLLRVVAARDGGLCRIKLPGGTLGAAQAHAIAAAAQDHANGTIELTNRANLQLRGVRAGDEAALADALLRAGLGPAGIDARTAGIADDLRNLMLSPLAGHDPDALFDTTTLVAPLLDVLQNEPRFAALTPKFAVLVDGGERLAALDHPHDIWLAAVTRDDGVRFALGLAGCPSAGGALALVAPQQAPATLRALLHAFLDLARPEHRRMRDLLPPGSGDDAAGAVLERANHYLDMPLARATATLRGWRRTPGAPSWRLGAHVVHADGGGYAGAQPPLGRLDSATLHALATLAEDTAAGVLRITPWQGLLLPRVGAHALTDAVRRLRALGLVCDPGDPFACLIACTGSAGCAKSHADTKTDAARLATRLPRLAAEVHLSGCGRSCAAAHRAPFTLLAAAPDRYDLYERGERDEPNDGAGGFGRLVAPALTLEAAAQAIARRTRSLPDV